MNTKRKSTLGTRPRSNMEAPRRLTTILNLMPGVGTDDELRNRNVTQHISKHKQPRSNKVSTQITSNKGSARRPAHTIMYKRSALKPANSTAVHKENLPHPESLKGQMTKGTLLKNGEETRPLTGGLRMMRERAIRARAARILGTPNSNTARKGEIMGNRTPLHMQFAQLTPQNLHFTKLNSDLPCSEDRNNVAKRQCKSISAFELLSCDTVSLQSKKIFVDENRMDHMSTNVTESHFGNENQENIAQEYQKPGTSYNLTTNELQKENTTNCYPSIQISSSFQNLKPSILQTDNFTSAYYNSNMEISQTKPITPRLNQILALSSGHLKTAMSSQDISSAEMQSAVESQVSEPKSPNISRSCGNSENILNVVFETNSALQKNSYEEINNCCSKNDTEDKGKDEAEVTSLKQDTESVREETYSLKNPSVMEIVKNMLNLQQRCKTKMEHFMEEMKGIQNQQFELLQKLSTVYQAAEERDECKQSSCITKESKASFSTDMSIEMECAESEKVLGLIVSEKKKRRSSRIANKRNSRAHSNAGTPDPCDKHTAVVAKYKDLQKSFTFLRTPRSFKTPREGKITTTTPRTIVSTSVRAQLQLLYDTDHS